MASSFALGYMLAVPVLTALTDRIDARLILLIGSAVSGLATFTFGVLAEGLCPPLQSGALQALGSPAPTCRV